MTRHFLAAPLLASIALLGCGPPAATTDGAAPAQDAGADLASSAWNDPPAPEPAGAATWRSSLSKCWTDVGCKRAMIVSHGGDWDWKAPYDSRAAFVRAVQRGADAIKADFRVTKDHVGVVAHSSPIELFESVDCQGRKIEEMTAAEVTSCHLLGTKETFQRVDDLLAWAHGRTIVMLTVKVPADLPRAVEVGIENHAEDDLFYEVHAADFLNIVRKTPGWERLHYLVWLESPDDTDAVLAAGATKQGFMFEVMDWTYPPKYDLAAMTAWITNKLHPAGIRAFTSTDTKNPTVENHQALFAEGFDVVMTYDLTNALQVRQAVNTARGISPP